MKTNNMATLRLRKSIGRSPSLLGFLLIPLGLAWLALSPVARADVCLEGCDLFFHNTFFGDDALINDTGFDNTAVGFYALLNNTTGYANTATGASALYSNTTGPANTADGKGALQNNTTGSLNTASGFRALFNNTSGNRNIAVGAEAGTGLTTGNENIDIGNVGSPSDDHTIRIGSPTGRRGFLTRTYIAGISVAPVMGSAVQVNSDGQLGTVASSQRFKEQIKPIDKASEAIFALTPVSFRYKKNLDPNSIPQFGLIAEEVEKVNPDLVARDADGKAYTVRYEAVNAMLLNEFLKEHRTVQELKKEIAALTATVKEQAAQIQKVSAQLEVNKPAPRTVANN
jgi:Chaperone of endosialidase